MILGRDLGDVFGALLVKSVEKLLCMEEKESVVIKITRGQKKRQSEEEAVVESVQEIEKVKVKLPDAALEECNMEVGQSPVVEEATELLDFKWPDSLDNDGNVQAVAGTEGFPSPFSAIRG